METKAIVPILDAASPPIAGNMSQTFHRAFGSCPSDQPADQRATAPISRRIDPEARRLDGAFEAYWRRIDDAQHHTPHWTPELRAERWAGFRNECWRMFRAARVPDRFRTIDLLKLPEWIPPGYRALSEILLGLRDKPMLIAIGGDRGRGKTAMAGGLIRAFCRLGRSALYARVKDFFDELDGAPWEQKPSAKERYATPSLLVLDEIQMRDAGKAWQDSELTTLIDRRYGESRATLLLSNLKPAALDEHLGESVKRRLSEEGGTYETDWPLLSALWDGPA
jgi:IstB-like ATP binding protein